MSVDEEAVLVLGAPGDVRTRAEERLRGEYPHIRPSSACSGAVAEIDLSEWLEESTDLLSFDRKVHAAEDASARPIGLRLVGAVDAAAFTRAASQVVRRYQRLFRRTNRDSRGAPYAEVLRRHRALHDLAKPLVRADYDHAIDVWQWVLELFPDASLAVQTAALFHDIERLSSEADARIEQYAADYQAYKDGHAAHGSELVAALLRELLPTQVLDGAVELVRCHERRREDAEVLLLNDADALSFFALNSAGFVAYFGAAHTEKKVAYTLERMGPRARGYLKRVRLDPRVRRLLPEAYRA